ncbi:hypothetical protein GCM10009624_18700 [Gordonia sinesedis]
MTAFRPVGVLPADIVQRLRDEPLSYSAVGGTAGSPPAGYRCFVRAAYLGCGADAFSQARNAMVRWQIQARSGVRVSASEPELDIGSVAILTLGALGFSVRAPVRVVDVVDTPREYAFAYGTLPGHPESGEERFTLNRRDDGQTSLTVTAFSRPAAWMTRLAGPVGRAAQDVMTRRYLRALAVDR